MTDQMTETPTYQTLSEWMRTDGVAPGDVFVTADDAIALLLIIVQNTEWVVPLRTNRSTFLVPFCAVEVDATFTLLYRRVPRDHRHAVQPY